MSFLYKQTIIKLTTAQLEKILEETNLAALAPIDVRPLRTASSTTSAATTADATTATTTSDTTSFSAASSTVEMCLSQGRSVSNEALSEIRNSIFSHQKSNEVVFLEVHFWEVGGGEGPLLSNGREDTLFI